MWGGRVLKAFRRRPPGTRSATTYALYDDSAFLDDEDFSTMMYDAIRAALIDEDVPMASSVQRKLGAGLVDRLVYGRNELILHHNHEGWNAELARFAVGSFSPPSLSTSSTG